MMIIGFKSQFIKTILVGTKIHTIRQDKSHRWRADRMIHMASDVRTGMQSTFGTKTCSGTQTIQIRPQGIDYQGFEAVRIDGKLVSMDVIRKLAVNDGFENAKAFFKWFNEDFDGVIIHWTAFRY